MWGDSKSSCSNESDKNDNISEVSSHELNEENYQEQKSRIQHEIKNQPHTREEILKQIESNGRLTSEQAYQRVLQHKRQKQT